MDKIEIFKALSNETRLSIIEWLKEPEKNFPPQGGHFDDVEASATKPEYHSQLYLIT